MVPYKDPLSHQWAFLFFQRYIVFFKKLRIFHELRLVFNRVLPLMNLEKLLYYYCANQEEANEPNCVPLVHTRGELRPFS